jgi:formylglycine-generating enzyme
MKTSGSLKTVLLFGIFFFCIAVDTQAQLLKASNIRDDMIRIPGGKACVEAEYGITAGEKDSTLFLQPLKKWISVEDFYISDHEVTYKEYKEFVDWVRDSISLSLIASKDASFYVDQTNKSLNWARLGETKIRDSLMLKRLSPLVIVKNNKYEHSWYYDNSLLNYSYQVDGKMISTFIYPDSISIMRDVGYQYNDPCCYCYFWHPAYEDYPVVGINWNQAVAYCDWKTRMASGEKSFLNIRNAYPHYRLPTEEEWEYAAECPELHVLKKNSMDRIFDADLFGISNQSDCYGSIFPWDGQELRDESGKYKALFGEVRDQNGFLIKGTEEGSCIYTKKIKSYPPNGFRLYDMAGNVAEFTSDSIIDPSFPYEDEVFSFYYSDFDKQIQEHKKGIDSIKKITKIYADDDLQTGILKINKRLDYYNELCNYKSTKINFRMGSPFGSWDKVSVAFIARAELHNLKILKGKNNLRIVKGGSWATGPAYMQIAEREVFEADKSSGHVGFRIVVSR